jgi:DNA-binding IscR family transcriptional regulator
MVPTRFAVAIHILLVLAVAERNGRPDAATPTLAATSFRLAARVRTNPVVVRRISGRLARAGLMRVRRGAGGAALAKPAEAITLDDVWLAVNAGEPRPLLALHLGHPAAQEADHAEADQRIHQVLAGAFDEAEAAFRDGLRRITLGTLAARLGTQPEFSV